MIERWFERLLFSSRWLLAPFYLALVVGLVILLIKTAQHTLHMCMEVLHSSETDVILGILSLVDSSLTGALVVIVIFSGYENFVSQIDIAQSKDWPTWMAKINFTGLKLKLLSSLVAISAVHMLRAFMNVSNLTDREITWYVVIHLSLVLSGLLLALTDRFADTHKSTEE